MQIYFSEEAYFDTDSHIVFSKGESISLQAKQIGLLEYLIDNAGALCKYDDIIQKVWGNEYFTIKNVTDQKALLCKKVPELAKCLTVISNSGIIFKPFFENLSIKSALIKPQICLGRENEIVQLNELVKVHSVIWILGPDGIGKSTLVKQYAYLNKKAYNSIIYIQVKKQLIDAIVDDAALGIAGMELPRCAIEGYSLKRTYFNMKIQRLRELCNDKTLIILDDCNVSDEDFEVVTSLPSKFIICSSGRLGNNDAENIIIYLDRILNISDVFFEYYKRDDIKREDEELSELFKYFGYNTAAIIFLAKQMMMNHRSPKEMIKILFDNKKKFSSEMVPYELSKKELSVYSYFMNLFKLNNLDILERKIMMILSFFYPYPVFASDIEMWSNSENVRFYIQKLNAIGLVEYDDYQDNVSLQTILARVIQMHEDKNVEFISNNFLKNYSIDELRVLNIRVKKYYANLGLVIAEFMKMYGCVEWNTILKIERLLCFASYVDEDIELLDWLMEKVPNNNFHLRTQLLYYKAYTVATCFRDRTRAIPMFEEAIRMMQYMTEERDVIELLPRIYADYCLSLVRANQIDDSIPDYITKAKQIIRKTNYRTQDIAEKCIYYDLFLTEYLVAKGDYSAADKIVTRLLVEYKNGIGAHREMCYADILYRKGMVLEKLNHSEEAFESLKKAYEIYVKIFPTVSIGHVQHLVHLGELALKLKRTKESYTFYKKAQDISSSLSNISNEEKMLVIKINEGIKKL